MERKDLEAGLCQAGDRDKRLQTWQRSCEWRLVLVGWWGGARG